MASAWEETIQQFRELHPHHRTPRIGAEPLSIFTRQLSAMIDAGIPLPRALQFFAEGDNPKDTQKIIDTVADKVFSGTRFSHSLRSFPGTFSEVYVALIETGESSGQLATALQRLAELLEKQVRMHKRIVATLTYPLILLFVSFVCVMLFIFFILPMIEPMFLSMKIELPLPTRIMLMSRKLLLPVVVLTAFVLVLGWIFRPFLRQFLNSRPPLRTRVAHIPLQLPLFGPVIRKVAVSRILYSLASMLDAGMGLVEAISRSSMVAGNRWIQERLLISKAAIINGETVAHSFDLSEVFPASAVQLITVGEETSGLSTMVKYVADMYDEDAEMALTDMANMLEPLMMGAMGIIVGFIVLSAMLPTMQLIQNL